MKTLIPFLFLSLIARLGSAQATYFSMDSIWVTPYICQAHTFNVEIYGYLSSGMVQATSQNYYVSQDSVYVAFHFGPGGSSPAVPVPMSRTINIPAPINFGRYKILARGYYNGQFQHALTSAISICSGTLATAKETKPEPELSIYPNPGQDLVQVKLPFSDQGSNLKLSDAAGKTVYNAEIRSGIAETQLNLKNLPSGLYLLQVTSPEKKITRKLIRH